MLQAAIFDLDGVITRTARLHAAAWKQVFDDFLRFRVQGAAAKFAEFDADHDYRAYVDGKPRYDGVASFLASRGIKLTWGFPSDPPSFDSVCGIGNQKNTVFNRLLEERGVDLVQGSEELLAHLRSEGIRVAVATSSKNRVTILARAGLEEAFEVAVDGNDLEREHLPGKPDPAIFLRAAELLGVEPVSTAVFEDAISGVEAGVQGGFGLVVGVGSNGAALTEHGADLVVPSVADVSLQLLRDTCARVTHKPNAIDEFDALATLLRGRRPAVFLDYDGTLTPIVDRPDQAVLSGAMRETLRRLASQTTTAILSGRERTNVEALVGIRELYYAGSHGFDISGPEGPLSRFGEEFVADIAAAHKDITERLGKLEGVLIENKTFAIAVHYRQVAGDKVETVGREVGETVRLFPRLRKTGGKKVFELRPDLPWDKGKALLWLLEALEISDEQVSLYIGDDVTDEDALRVVEARGIGIVVTDVPRRSRARFSLRSTLEVGAFLDKLADLHF